MLLLAWKKNLKELHVNIPTKGSVRSLNELIIYRIDNYLLEKENLINILWLESFLSNALFSGCVKVYSYS